MSVYFAQSETGGPVKIGFSENPEERVASLAQEMKLPLRVIATMDGGRGLEGALHHKFSGTRTPMPNAVCGSSEFFAATRDLVAQIQSLGGSVVGPVLDNVPPRPPPCTYNINDGAILLRKHLSAIEMTTTEAAIATGLSRVSFCNWIICRATPDVVCVEILEIWSDGTIPAPQWLTRDGVMVFDRHPWPRGRTQDQIGRNAILTRFRAKRKVL